MDKKTLEIQIKLLANQALSQVKEFGADIKNAADKAKGFTGDAKGVSTSIKAMQAEAQRTANQLKLFGLTSSDLRNTTQNLKKTILDLTDSGLKPESEEVQNLVQKYKELEEQTNKAEASEQGLFGVIGKLKNEIGSLASVAAAVKVDKTVADLAKSSLDVNNSFQKIKDDFGIMLGDVEAGIGLFNELQEFNFWTPFDIEQTSQAAKVLVSAKVPLKDLTDYLTRFGDIAQGDAQKFQSYINAFSKASAKGKADMEVLNVYTDQGVQILDALGQQLGKTSEEIVKMASEGKISSQDLDNALNALASEGGLYYGTLEKAAMRLDAVQAGLQESVKSLKASFGQMLAPAVSAVLTVFTNLVDKINSSPILKGLLAAAIAAITVAVNALAVVAIVKLITNLNLASVAAAGLGVAINTALPIIGAISVVVGVVTTALVANASAHQKAADAAAEHAKKMKELDNSYKDWLKTANQSEAMKAYENYSKQAASQRTTVNNLKNKLANTQEYTTASQNGYKYRKKNPEYDKLKTQVKEAEDLLADYEQKRDAASRRITQAQKEDQQKLKDHAAQMVEAASKLGTEWQNKLTLENAKSPIEELQFEQQQALEKLAEKASSLYDGDINKWDAYLTEKAALNEYYNKKIADENKKIADDAEKEAEKAKKILQDWIDKGDPIGALERQRAAAQKELADSAEKLYGKNYKTQENYIRANKELEKEYDEKIAAAKEKQLKDYSSKWEQLLRNIQQNLERAMLEKNLPAAAVYAAQGAALQGTQNTEAGQVAQGFANGGALGGIVAILQAFVGAIIKAIEALENGQKVLNFISTIVGKIFDVIGPLVDEALGPTVRLLELLGTTIGKLLKPLAYFAAEFAKNETFIRTISVILEGLCALLDILFQVLKPIIDVIIQILKIFGYIANPAGIIADQLYKTADDIEKINDEMEKQQEMLKKKYQRMQDAVKEQLDSQLAALKSQYELGLISREQYEKQAEKYASDADEKIYALEKEMNQKLEEIQNNTKDTADSTEKTSEEAKSADLKLGNMNLGLGNIFAAISGINELVKSSITIMTNTITSSITSLNSAITDSIVKIIEAITKLTTGLIPGFGGGSGGSGGLPGLGGGGSGGSGGAISDPISITHDLPGVGGIIDTVTDGIANSDPVQVGVGVLTGGLIDTHDSVGDNIANVLTGGLWGGIKNLFGWDVGSWSIPEDQMAMVHQGEIIVPRTFSEGIRRGELSLSSNGNVSKSESPLYVTVNVGGSVVTENQLIDSVYNGIRKGINSKRYSPLGAA